MTKIQILGTGCAKCHKLTDNAKRAAEELQIAYELEKIEDITEILKFGVMGTPALAIDGDVKSVGKVLSTEEIKALLA